MNLNRKNALQGVFLSALILFGSQVSGQTLFSRFTPANWNNATAWSLTNGGGSCGCYPGDGTHDAGFDITINAGHVITLTSTAYTLNSIKSLTVNGTLNFGDNSGTSKTLAVVNDVAVGAGGTIQSGATAAVLHQLQIGRNLTNDNVFNMNAGGPTNQTVIFTGTGTISGAGSNLAFYTLSMNTAGLNVSVNKTIQINGLLNFPANGILIVNSTSNVIMASGAGFGAGGNAPSATKYIQLDGGTGTNSQLIKTSNGTAAAWQVTYPIGTSTGGYSPVVFGAVGGIAPSAGSTLTIKAIYSNSIQGQLRRTFRFTVAGNATATTFSGPTFTYNTTLDLSAGDALANYTSIWHLSTATGSWTNPAGTAPGAGTFSVTAPSHNLVTGTYYYTIGSSTAYPNTWYSYQTGVWSDYLSWTLDPSGTTFVNGLNQPPLAGDAIVILNGITITNDVNGQVVSSTIIQGGGTLDMSNTTGNTLGTVDGEGTLRIKGVSLPTGTYTSFVASTGGTFEYYDVGGTLPGSAALITYNKLKLTNSTGSNIVFITNVNPSTLTINGTLDITGTGAGTVTWQINGAAAARQVITIAGDVTVSALGKITAGTGGAGNGTPHSLTLSGNLTNNGTIQFFDPTTAPFTSVFTSATVTGAAYQAHGVNVTFRGVSDATLTCNGPTDFYRLILNKGTGQQALLTLNSSSTTNFRLFGPAGIGSSGTAPNEISDNALSLVNGTVKFTGSTTIPILSMGSVAANDYFSIPQNAGMWLAGTGTITVTTAGNTGDQRLMIDGLLRVSSGALVCGNSRGIGSGDAGIFLMEGGTVRTWQFRPRSGGTGVFVYNQTGGKIYIGTTAYTPPAPYVVTLDATSTRPNGGSQARFDMTSTTSSFQMSGGEMHVGTPTNVGNQGINIACSAANYSVTGGTIFAYVLNGGNQFNINSTAPFYDLVVFRTGGAVLAQLVSALTVLNDFTLVNGSTAATSPSFNCNGQSLTLGGDITVQTNAVLTPGGNTITVNGTGTQLWTTAGTITSPIANLIINKTAGTATLAGALPNVTNLTLTSGTLDDGGTTIAVTGTISNSATHSGTGKININGPTAIGGVNGTFGNVDVNTAGTITTSGNQTVSGTLALLVNATISIGSNNLKANAITPGVGAFGATRRVLTNGFRNDGGLTLKGAGGNLVFPVGTTVAAYSPATIDVTATTHGYLTVCPVKNEHPNVVVTGKSLRYFWAVTSTGYIGITAVSHTTYNFGSAALLGGTIAEVAAYNQARYDPITRAWFYKTAPYVATLSTTIPTFNTNVTFSPSNNISLDGEYTTGNSASFIPTATWKTYYSKGGSWTAGTSWSTVAVGGIAAGTTPCSTCPVIIGNSGGGLNHTIIIPNSTAVTVGSLFVDVGSKLDCGTVNAALNFGVNTSGTGTVSIGSASFPAGDFTNFLKTGGGTIEYYGGPYTIPTASTVALLNYNNLKISPSGGQDITLPPANLTIYGDMTISGTVAADRAVTNSAAARTLTLNNSLIVTGGTFSFANNTAATSTTIVVSTGISILGGAMSVQGTGSAGSHVIRTTGSILNNGTLDLEGGPASTTAYNANIFFTGTNNVSLTGTGSADLAFVNINKGTNSTTTVTFDMSGGVTTTIPSWLVLTNGTFYFKNAGTYLVSSAAFTIPSTAKLKVESATVTIASGNVTGSDLFLNGALEVTSGTLNVGLAGNTLDNDIEYASAGTPSITLSGGTLAVGGAIRRSTNTLSGALAYNQSAGTVTLGGKNPTFDRGIFEIDFNPGSSFTMSGGTLNILRPNTNVTGNYADLYLNPVTASVSAASTINMGLLTTIQNFRANIAPSLGSFGVVGGTSAANVQTVTLQSNDLILAGGLTVNTNAALATNGLNVFIGGNLTASGTYNGAANTTTFDGAGAQAGILSAASSFLNMTVNKSSGTLTLSGTAPTLNNLNILNGVLDVGALTLNVNNNVTNNSSQINTGGVGSITLAGAATAHTITSGNGAFSNLSLGGAAASKFVTVNGNMTINGILDFTALGTSRFLFIGSNQLTFSTTGSVLGQSGLRFIKTNGVSSDLGVVKTWPASTTTTFTYAVGTRINYTPVILTNLPVNASGTLTVVPVDDQHPTASALGEQILNYYWIVTRNGTLTLSAATGSHAYQFPSGLVGGAVSASTFYGAYLNAISLVGWTAGPVPTGVNPLTITYSNSFNTTLPAASGRFDYTAGTNQTLPNPITPVYSRFADADGISNPTTVGTLGTGGTWNLATNWTLASTGNGTGLSTVPAGRPVVVLSGARINMDVVGKTAFATTISGLVVVTTTGHNLGTISGTGTMRTSVSTLPAGTYTSFVAAGGGTIEYIAPMTMNNRSTYNNLSILATSAGIVTMTNTDLVINGNLSIPAAGITLDNTVNNRNISIAGNWSNTGTFSPGTGTVIFNGTTAQSITGATTFSGLTVSKTNNLTLNSVTTVNGLLTLTAGNIVSTAFPAAPRLLLGSSSTLSGGSVSSFIDGQARKTVATGGSYTFALGSITAARYRPVTIGSTISAVSDDWTASYIGRNPNLDGFPFLNLDGANMKKVSQYEYWQVANASGTSTGSLTLSFGPGSYGGANIGILSLMKTARWNSGASRWELPPGGGTFSQTGTNVTGTVTVSFQNSFSPQTLATDDINSTLPIELLDFTAALDGSMVKLNWATATEVNNDFFTVERSADLEQFESVAVVKGQGTKFTKTNYESVDEYPLGGRSYYRLKQTDYNGQSTYSGVRMIDNSLTRAQLKIYPNPISGNRFTLEANYLNPSEEIIVRVINLQGVSVFEATYRVDESGSMKRFVELNPLSNGLYAVLVISSSGLKKRVVLE